MLSGEPALLDIEAQCNFQRFCDDVELQSDVLPQICAQFF
jgi:hypothetical protein